MPSMRLTPPTKTVLVLVLLVATLAYGLLIEFAVNAGRVHHGVDVQGLDIGGLNPAEAQEVLEKRGTEMKLSPIVFTTEGFDCRFTPEQLGWGPQAFDTTQAAMTVGRRGGPFEALRERLRAWTSGVTVEWQGSPARARIRRELDRCEERSKGLGLEVDRRRLRRKIKKAIVTWPRPPFTIPLEA